MAFRKSKAYRVFSHIAGPPRNVQAHQTVLEEERRELMLTWNAEPYVLLLCHTDATLQLLAEFISFSITPQEQSYFVFESTQAPRVPGKQDPRSQGKVLCECVNMG